MASSTGSKTWLSITSGAAPFRLNDTLTTGKSTSGSWLTPNLLKERRPKTMRAAISIHAKTGLRIESSERLIYLSDVFFLWHFKFYKKTIDAWDNKECE